MSTLGGYFVQLLVLWGHVFCSLSGDIQEVVHLQRLKISMAKLVGGHIVCLLYGSGPYLIESVMGGSTVPPLWWLTGAWR